MTLQGLPAAKTLAGITLAGVMLMCTRLLFGAAGQAADNDHIIGSLVITLSIMAWGEMARRAIARGLRMDSR